jgi:two-component system, chemotaxis family, response regulator Rcp1
MDAKKMKPIKVLLIEDNPGDVRLTREALREGKIEIDLTVADDGEAALAYLLKEGPYADAPRPDLIMLDLNLPKIDGRDVLARVKSEPHLKLIPVVVLTTSKAEEDILKAYHLNANCYIVKPVDYDQFLKIVKMVDEFWLTIVSLPTECKP